MAWLVTGLRVDAKRWSAAAKRWSGGEASPGRAADAVKLPRTVYRWCSEAVTLTAHISPLRAPRLPEQYEQPAGRFSVAKQRRWLDA